MNNFVVGKQGSIKGATVSFHPNRSTMHRYELSLYLSIYLYIYTYLFFYLLEEINLCTSGETCNKCLLKGEGCYWCTDDVSFFTNNRISFQTLIPNLLLISYENIKLKIKNILILLSLTCKINAIWFIEKTTILAVLHPWYQYCTASQKRRNNETTFNFRGNI